MAWTSGIFTAVTGSPIRASDWNTYGRDNLNAIWVGSAAGDMDYYTSATAKNRLVIGPQFYVLYSSGTAPIWGIVSDILQFRALIASQAGGDLIYAGTATALARLGISAAGGILTSTGTAPAWTATRCLPGSIHASGAVDWTSGQTITNTSYTNISNATLDLVTTVTCTFLLRAHGVMATSGAGGKAMIRGVVGATNGTDRQGVYTSNPYYVPFAIAYSVPSVAAGTTTCKLQGKANTNGGNDNLILDYGHLEVLAIAE